jgi:signal transduction histidine kinase
VVTAWSGIASITVHTPEQPTDLNRWHLAVDAIEEAVANAVRHGKATTIDVATMETPDCLEIRIADDGGNQVHVGCPGVGQAWFDSISPGRWQHVKTPTGTALTMQISLEQESTWGFP